MKKRQGIKKTRAFKNIFYSIHLIWGMKKGTVIHSAITQIINYVSWVFYSYFFIRYLVGAIENAESFSHIFRFVLIAGGFFMLTAIYGSYMDGAYMPLAGVIINQKLYEKLYKKAGNVELRCFEDSSFYNKYTLAIDDARDKMLKILQNFHGIIVGTIAAIVVFSMMFLLDKFLVLFALFPMIGNFVIGYFSNKEEYNFDKAKAPYKRIIDYINRVMYLSDYSKEIRLSRVFNLMKHKYIGAINGIYKVTDYYAFRIIIPVTIKNVLTYTLTFQGVLLYGAYRAIIGNTMDLAELAVLSSIMTSATFILNQITDSIQECIKQGLFVENLRTFLDYEEELPEDYDGIMPEEEIDSIEFCNVSFTYKEGAPVIKNLSFTLKGKTRIAFVGHNGAGKTTIIKLLFRLYDPEEGEILLNGRNIKEYNLRAYRRLFTAAFQDYKVFALSIRENVMMEEGCMADDEIVIEALQKAGVYDKVMTLPKGIDTILTKEFDKEGSVLSGGEYQKIVVARSFAKDVPLKVFDEPSSALDPIAEYELYESILRESMDKTMIFISHRLSSVRNMDMVFMLEQGTVLEQGTHEELMKQDGAYADMYNKQAKNYLALENAEEVSA